MTARHAVLCAAALWTITMLLATDEDPSIQVQGSWLVSHLGAVSDDRLVVVRAFLS